MVTRTGYKFLFPHSWNRTLTTSILTLNLLAGFFLPAYLLAQGEGPVGKVSSSGNWNYFLEQKGPPSASKTLVVIDSKMIIRLTSTAYLHIPTHPCPVFSLYKPGSISGTLETVFETLIGSLPSNSLIERYPFLVSPPRVSLPLVLSVASG